MKTLKYRLREKLHELNIPFLALLSIKFFTRNNIYVEKNKVSLWLYKLLKTLKGYEFFSITTTGALVLMYKEHVVKIPLGKISKESLKINYDNYLKLKGSDLGNLVEYNLSKKDCYYIMERLDSIKPDEHEIKVIIEQLSKISSKIKLQELKDELFSNLPSLEKTIKTKIYFPSELEVECSIMHGDLTQDNIMKNKNDNLVLIDLDRFTFHGIKGFDFIHYEVDKISKQKRMIYFDYLVSLESNKEYLTYIYLLYRISNEYKEGITLNDAYYFKMKKTIEILKEKN